MPLRYVIIVLFMLSNGALHPVESSECPELVVCALDNCIDTTDYQIVTQPKIIPDLLNRTDFTCVLGNQCFDHCEKCGSCYQSFVEDKKKGASCQEFKTCAHSCIKENRFHPFECIFQKRCVKYCIDDIKCPACYDFLRRLFTGFCHRQELREIFRQPCRAMFDELAVDYRLRRLSK